MTGDEFREYAEATKRNIEACARILGPLSNEDQNAIALQVARIQRARREMSCCKTSEQEA